MKDLYITIHNGGDEAVAAVERMGEDWRQQLEQAAKEVEALRITNAEREAVRYMIAAAKFGQRDDDLTEEHAATLRGLLERTK